MAKKSRRARRQRATRLPSTPSTPPAAQGSKPWAVPANDVPAAVASPSRPKVDFGTEYHYVISDLRSMAIIALAMLGVLIALSFVIN
ncbi:MAG: hypothetical protein JSV81_14115 [Anaerolineales bacterium]|nr:MAG: hypothetical protein JSV81_14115 [Anaerolineales bacterium]